MRKLTNDELGRLDNEAYKNADKNPIIIVLDNIRSMHNVGSAFRTSDSFRIEKIYLCGITACPPHREIHKTALGATESVDWEYFEETSKAIEQIKQNGYKIISIEQAEKSVPLNEYVPDNSEKLAFVFGNEIKGVQQEIVSDSNLVIEIPQFGTKHSLNVSVSIGIVIWDVISKLNFNR